MFVVGEDDRACTFLCQACGPASGNHSADGQGVVVAREEVEISESIFQDGDCLRCRWRMWCPRYRTWSTLLLIRILDNQIAVDGDAVGQCQRGIGIIYPNLACVTHGTAVVDLESRAPKHSDITSEVVGRIREDVRSTPQKVDMITGQLRIQGQRSAGTRRETRIAESGFT